MVDHNANPRNVSVYSIGDEGNTLMDLTCPDLTADELERVVGGDIQHGWGSGEDICARWFDNGNGITCLIVYGPCATLYL